MEENLQFIFDVIDAAWFATIAIRALSWVLLCRGVTWKHSKRAAGEFLLLAGAMLVGQLPMMLITLLLGQFNLQLLFQILLLGVLGAVFLHLCSDCQAKTKMVMWCSMLAGSFAINSISGQCSFLVGEFLARGAAEAVARLAVCLLTLPLAVYLHSFSRQDYEQVPVSGMAAILIGDASILAMNILEALWAGADYRITITFLVAYVFLLLMVVAAIQCIYDMNNEQSKVMELQAERQRLQGERELARMADDNLEELRGIRHDLKNQYAYMQILLSQQRYGELEEYFQQSVEHLLPQVGQIVECGNRALNVILNMEFAKARKAGVVYTHQLVVPPVLPFSEDDVCAAVTNLLDNAIEECTRLRRTGHKDASLRIEIYPQKSYLFIQCCNTTDRTRLERSNRGLRTTKGDERFHGYGTRIISRIAEKYNGCAEFGLSNGTFVAKVLLDMTVEETL